MLLDYLKTAQQDVVRKLTENFERRYPALLSQLWAEGIRYAVTEVRVELLYAHLTFSRGQGEPGLVLHLAPDGTVNSAGQPHSEASLARVLAEQVHEWDAPARRGQWEAQHRVLSKLPGALLLAGFVIVLLAGFSAKPRGADGWALLAAGAGVVTIFLGGAGHVYAGYQRGLAVRQPLDLTRSRFNWAR